MVDEWLIHVNTNYGSEIWWLTMVNQDGTRQLVWYYGITSEMLVPFICSIYYVAGRGTSVVKQ